MTFAEYLQSVVRYQKKYGKHQRIGQMYVNCLPDGIANDIRMNHSFIDPFYDDSKLPDFLAYVEVMMED